jgi:hypothetical protein
MAVEPAWHRRARRLRSGHRLLAQVSAACVKLAGHHGSSPPEILRPLLYALSKYAPRPCDVPWPDALLSIGSHRSPKTMLMPNSDITDVAVDPAVASSSSTLSSLVQGSLAGGFSYLDIPEVAVVSPVASTSPTSVTILTDGVWRPLSFNTSYTSSSTCAGDFRSLPGDYWRTISFPFTTVTHPFSLYVREFRALMLQEREDFLINRSTSLRIGPPDHPHIFRVSTCYDNCLELIRNSLSQLPALLTEDHFPVLKRVGQTYFVCLAPLKCELNAAIQDRNNFLAARACVLGPK